MVCTSDFHGPRPRSALTGLRLPSRLGSSLREQYNFAAERGAIATRRQFATGLSIRGFRVIRRRVISLPPALTTRWYSPGLSASPRL